MQKLTKETLYKFIIKKGNATLQEMKEEFGISKKDSYKLHYHLNNLEVFGIKKIKQGIYSGETYEDLFEMLLKIHPKNILSYHTALEFYGFSHTEFFTKYLTNPISKKDIENFQNYSIKFVSPLINEFKIIEKNNKQYKVTSVEQTIIECLLRLKYCGGFEELFKCLEFLKEDYFKYEEFLRLLNLYNKKKAYNLLGFFLEKNSKLNGFQISKNFENKLLLNKTNIPFTLEEDLIPGTKMILNKKWNIRYSQSLEPIFKGEY